ncbi:MAG: tetratricopeptide repeat protein [Cellvibrionaceae bacterium]|nr:tetratricopeptide repeat protein [Cellvibrionaceae bacterium]
MNKLPQLIFCSLLLYQSCSYLSFQADTKTPTANSQSIGTDLAQTKPTPKAHAETGSANPPATKVYGNFSADTLYALLVAEVAAARRQYSLTLNTYMQQAQATQDLGIITHAAWLTQFFRAHEQSLEIGDIWLAQAPESVEALSLIGNAHLELAQFTQALDFARRMLAQFDPASPEGKRRASLVDTIASRSRNASSDTLQHLQKTYLSLVEQYPEYAAVGVGLSKIHEHQGDIPAALASARRARAADSNHLPALLQEANLLQQNKQTHAAIDLLKTEMDKHPDKQRLRLFYARLLMQTDINAAFSELGELTKARPEQADIKFLYALAAIESKAWKIAEANLTALLAIDYRNNTLHFYLGNIAETQGDDAKALHHYRLVKEGDEFIGAQNRAGRLLAKIEGPDAVNHYFDKLREQFPKLRASLFGVEADALSRSDYKQRALALLSSALTEFPDNSHLRYSRSTLYEQTDNLNAMEADLRHILRAEPNNASALNALGYFLTSRTDRHQEALVLIEKALAIKPEDAAIIDSMGWVLFNLGQHDKAISHLRRAFALFPDAEVAAHLGEALWIQGEQEEARTIWSTTLRDNPNNAFILDTVERLGVEL